MTISSSKGMYVLNLLGIYKRNVLFERFTMKWSNTDYPNRALLMEEVFPQNDASGKKQLWVVVNNDNTVEVFDKSDNYAGTRLSGTDIRRFFKEHQGINCGVFVEMAGMPGQYDALTWK